MDEERDKPPAIGDLEVVETLATTETREHLLARRSVDGEEELVVVQRLTPRASQAADFVEIYTAEAEHASVLDHENVLRILEVVDEGPHYDIICERVEGTPLDNLLGQLRDLGRVMPVEHALTLMLDVSAGVAAAHAVRDPEVGTCVLHQDLAPENVIIAAGGTSKVSDFGIGRASRMSSVTVVGGRQRRLGRLSPEQLVGRTLNERSDVYGLGVMLYEVTCGLPPFQEDSDFALMAAIDGGKLTPPSARVAGYLPDLEALVCKAMSTDPEERFGDAGEMRDALAKIGEAHGIEPDREALARWVDEQMSAEVPEPAPPARSPAPPPVAPSSGDEDGPRHAVRSTRRRRKGLLAWLRRLFGAGR